MDVRVGLDRLSLPPGGACRRLLGVALLGMIVAAGCAKQQTRLHSADETEQDRYQVSTIGEKTQVGSARPIPVSGVGLVEGLEGTGGDTPGNFHGMLEEQLRKEGVRHVRDLLSSPDNALVLVSALVPPGAHKGDPLDIEVTLPRGSRATSLRGGRLRLCKLFNYDFAKNLRPEYSGPANFLVGHPIAEAEGVVLVGMGADDDAQRGGRIWGGGRTKIETPLTLDMNSDQQRAQLTALIADRVNETFQPEFKASQNNSVARAQDKVTVYLRVPAAYKLNLPRYLRVVRLIPLQEGLDAPSADAAGKPSYRRRLTEDLLDPARTVTAALRLEALGHNSIPALKQGLASDHPLVRFCSAEALLYLGSPSGADEVAKAVSEQPLLRPFGLTALASLDEAVCQVKLGELLANAPDDETRYGAFRALHTLDENNRSVRGELLNDSFWLHRSAPNTPPLVHVSTTKRAEIVLFGEEPFLRAPFWFMAGEFAVTAAENDSRCTISHFPLRGAPARRQCSLKLEDVLRTLAEMGGNYPEAVAVLRQADKIECLSCRVRYDALPQAVSVYELVQAGKDKTESDLVPGGQDLGGTPTLYETNLPSEESERKRDDKSGAQRNGVTPDE